MISARERRFIRSWEEQRKGGPVGYFILYIIVGGFIITILTFIVMVWMLQMRVKESFLIIPVIGIVVSSILTSIGWFKNEKRLKSIIRREIEKGKQNDGHQP